MKHGQPEHNTKIRPRTAHIPREPLLPGLEFDIDGSRAHGKPGARVGVRAVVGIDLRRRQTVLCTG